MTTAPTAAATSAAMSAAEEPISTLHIRRDRLIKAPAQVVWDALLAQIGPDGDMPDGSPFPMVLEPWPGGRWYRDLGNNTGHFWAHVQVIKPPKLLELTGPMFMSYAATSHIQYRLTPEGAGTRLLLVHRAIGQITSEHRTGVVEGWDHELEKIRQKAERRA